jgi:Uma2 family endonuclease
MTTVELPASPQRFALRGISWGVYQELRSVPEMYNVRMTFDGGRLEMMSPSALHERFSRLVDRLIYTWTEEQDIDIASLGTMTVRREDLQKGFEPDNCYYVRHESLMREKAELDFSVDPPPDLAVEVDVSRSSAGKLALYAAVGVPEVWRYDGQRIEVYTLGPEQRYSAGAASVCFPGFPLDEAARVLARWSAESERALVGSFREFVRREGLSP